VAAAADGPAPDAADGGWLEDAGFDDADPKHPASSTQPITTAGHQRRHVVPTTYGPPRE
jgi:hypothetical protein